MTKLRLRPLQFADVPTAERLTREAFAESERTSGHTTAAPEPWGPEYTRSWIRRTRHFLETDPAGCWAIDDDETLVGIATSITRDRLWILATFAVLPQAQGHGVGKALLEAPLEYFKATANRGMFSASSDPKALQRYRAAGFQLHPQTRYQGQVDRSALPPSSRSRKGSLADIRLLGDVDRSTRGASHGPDHALMQSMWELLVIDEGPNRGYAYLDGGCVELLAATDPSVARELLWEGLARANGVAIIPRVTEENAWARKAGQAIGLEATPAGFLAVVGMTPPAHYLHNGELL